MAQILELLKREIVTSGGEGWDNQWEPMPRMLDPFQFLLVAIAGWMNQRQLQVIEYLREENRVLREQLGELAQSFWFFLCSLFPGTAPGQTSRARHRPLALLASEPITVGGRYSR